MNHQGADATRNTKEFDAHAHITEFIRLPPGLQVPSIHANSSSNIAQNTQKLTTGLDDHINVFTQRAKDMFKIGSSLPMSPGHPLYTYDHMIDTLKEENAKIRNENAKLRQNLDNSEHKSRQV